MELNKEQKQAVEHKNGPLLIIAGAGTGKTRVITSRILHLINNEGVDPSEILALTFTEKAANEMVERVDMEMKLGYEEICIKTFHSFSDQILREVGHEIGLSRNYKLLTAFDQWFFFKKHLFDFDLNYYRPLGNPNHFIYDLLSHFSRLKDEVILPEEYIEYAHKIEDEDEKKKMLEIGRAFKKYQELLIKGNSLDFADLTYYVLKLFKERPSVLKEYQNKYKYILVDEFQDTNYAQFELVMNLAKSHKNICVVGDDDQSIYKWRGASLSNILQFEKHSPKAEKIVLSMNYRSTQNVLDSAYKLIQNNNPDRLEVKNNVNKHLKCSVTENDPVEIHHFNSFLDETEFVCRQISEIQQKEKSDFSNFAILIRANELGNSFVSELESLQIPYQIRNPKGLISLPEIKDIVAVIKFLANPFDDVSLLRIMKIDVLGITMAKILEILNLNKKDHLINLFKSYNLSLPGMETSEEKLKELLDHLIEFSKNNPVGLVCNEFLQKSGYLQNLVDKEKFEEIDNINEFAKHVAKFERENESKSVSDFAMYLDLLEEANLTLQSDLVPDKNSVQIMTVHAAKGLEFPYVFIVNAVKGRFPSTKRRDGFYIPDELTKEIYPEGDFHLQEERRLFYVAMTRAKKKLFVTYSDQYEGNKKWKTSPFVEEIEDLKSINKINHKKTESSAKKLLDFKKPKAHIFNLPPFKKNKLSYSQFDTFKTCPLKYSYRYMMKVPVPPSHATNFGSSIHHTLNEFYQMLKTGEGVSLEKLQVLYEKNWIPYGYENREHEDLRKKQGIEILKNYYEKNSNPWIVPTHLERPFNLKIGDTLISGRIDRIDRLKDGTYEVIDYKTGRVKDYMNLQKDLQLSVYAWACRDILKISVSKLSLYYLEDNEKFSTTRTDEQIDQTKDEILEIIKEMESSNFSPIPGFHCRFCDFRPICPAV